jgi:hypothetical protein
VAPSLSPFFSFVYIIYFFFSFFSKTELSSFFSFFKPSHPLVRHPPPHLDFYVKVKCVVLGSPFECIPSPKGIMAFSLM